MGINWQDHEPFIVPLSIPGMAGPSSMATVMLLSSGSAPERMLEWIGALAVVMFGTGVLLYYADWIQRKRKCFTVAMERLMGMILVALSVQMLLTGVAFIG